MQRKIRVLALDAVRLKVVNFGENPAQATDVNGATRQSVGLHFQR